MPAIFKKLYFTILLFIIFSLLLTLNPHESRISHAQTSSQAGQSPDAIAIRVIPNPEHFSALRWYQTQGFTHSTGSGQAGSPRIIKIDGYNAIQDGRTIYVNAANITGNQLYTNIYLISYNQNADPATINILNKMVSHWKFNTNIITPGACSTNNQTHCLTDQDCLNQGYCSSLKAKIIRDTTRLADLAEITIALNSFQAKKGYFPKLEAGTYLAQKTISTWPSWSQTLAKELSATLPKDPINKLGSCPDYDPDTCWNEQTKEFSGSLPDNLPLGSRAYIYSAQDTHTYHLCAIMESGYINPSTPEACAQSQEIVEITTTYANHSPVIQINTPVGTLDQPYTAYITAYDPDNDDLSNLNQWSLNTSQFDSTGWNNQIPTIQNTELPQTKKIALSQATKLGGYDLAVTIIDNHNGQTTKNFTISVGEQTPYFTSTPKTETYICQDYEYEAQAVSPANTSLTYSHNNTLPQGLTIVNANTGLIQGRTEQIGSHHIKLTAQTPNNTKGYQEYILTIKQASLSLNPISNQTVYAKPKEIDDITNIYLGPVTVFPQAQAKLTPNLPDFTINYQIIDRPNWATIDPLTGKMNITPETPGTYQITVKAFIPNCSLETTTSFTIEAQENQYCGDNLFQGDFGEQCDQGSNNSNQGECNTNCELTYCGDGQVQPTNGHNQTEQCEAPGTGSSASDQYECTNCQWTGGWCGNNTTEANYEDCDEGSANSTSPTCNPTCKFTFCGDNIIQTPNGNNQTEQCEPPNSEGDGSSQTNQYLCNEECLWSGGWCGDGIKNGNEACDASDGVATSPSSSSENKQYSCTANCEYTGGYCGDGVCNSSYESGSTCTADCGVAHFNCPDLVGNPPATCNERSGVKCYGQINVTPGNDCYRNTNHPPGTCYCVVEAQVCSGGKCGCAGSDYQCQYVGTY